MNIIKKIAVFLLICTTYILPLSSQPKLTPYNIDEIIKAMTVEEKAQLLVGIDGGMFKSLEPLFTRGKTEVQTVNMIGQSKTSVPGAAGATRAIPRLGIPSTILADGPAGLRISPTRDGDSNTYYCTGFPVGTLLASTWNTDLVQKVGAAIGNEVKEYGVDVLLAPGLNIMRHPLCGRNFEYYSEDPLLSGMIASAYINGVQSQGVGTSAKHFAVNNQETNRLAVDARVSQRALREIYLKNFEIMVKESQPWTIMSSYNRLNGTYTQESRDLLTTILRDEWGFKGIVVTDWTPLRNTAAQVAAGNDLMEPGMDLQVSRLVNSINIGEVSMADVDTCVRHILQYIVRTPAFNGYKFSNKPDLKAHAAVTRQSAAEGIVLLKNKLDSKQEPALPLKKETTDTIALFGITSYDFLAGGTGSGDVNKAYTIDLLTGLKNAGFSYLSDIEELYTSYRTYQNKYINTLRDWKWYEAKPRPAEISISENFAKRCAEKSDVAIITVGRQAGEGADRTEEEFILTDAEQQTIKNVCSAYHSAGKKVIVILNVGSSIETVSWRELPDAILCAWQTGQEGGNSVFDILTGDVCPSGKLTQTFPVGLSSIPSTKNFPMKNCEVNMMESYMGKQVNKKDVGWCNYDEGIFVGYRYFDSTKKTSAGTLVSYPFGYGLSYTTFAYSKPKIKKTHDGFVAQITITNTGKTAGKEVVELFVAAPQGKVVKPAHELKAFAKTRTLKPGEHQILSMPVSAYSLSSFVESESAWIADKGKYVIQFAANSNDICQTAIYTLTSPIVTKVHDVLAPQEPLSDQDAKTVSYNDVSLQPVAEYLQNYIKTLGPQLSVLHSQLLKNITLTLSDDPTLYKDCPKTYGVSPKTPVDESYNITTTDDHITITGHNPEAVFRGVNTLLTHQSLSTPHPDGGLLPTGKMQAEGEAPSFAWRGLSLDVVRNFYTTDEVKEVIDIMSLYNLNVLHLHLTDNEGWRIEIKSHPELAQKGGFLDNKGRQGGYYTQEEFRELVKYAADRFITIVPEIDIPGHSKALLTVHPELPNTSSLPFEFNMPGQALASLDPDDPTTVNLVSDIIKEVASLAPGDYIHIGGDETFGMNEDKYTRFVKKIREMVHANEKKVLGWQEMTRADVGNGDVFQNWIAFSKKQMAQSKAAAQKQGDATQSTPSIPDEVRKMLGATYMKAPLDIPTGISNGAKVLLSPSSFVYMDCPYEEKSLDSKQDTWQQTIGNMSYARQNLQDMYDWNPTTYIKDLDWTTSVAGVEGAIWCENITSLPQLEFMLLPRLVGIAEKAWYGNNATAWEDYKTYLATQSSLWKVHGWNFFKSELVDWK